MSIHLAAKPGDIADTVLLPGDPLRARFIAETFLEKAECYNEIRGMYGYTGLYKGRKISVQGTGMGVPSISIYVEELINEYGVKNLIRVGTCGSLQKDIKLGDVIIAMGACTDSNINRLRFSGMDFAPLASFSLLQKAVNAARNAGLEARIGNILTSDIFYFQDEIKDPYYIWRKHGVLAVEMETAALYTIAAAKNARALSILTASDNLFTNERSSAEERQNSFVAMLKLALEVAYTE